MFSVADIESEHLCFLVKLGNFDGVLLLVNDVKCCCCCLPSRFMGSSRMNAILFVFMRFVGDEGKNSAETHCRGRRRCLVDGGRRWYV